MENLTANTQIAVQDVIEKWTNKYNFCAPRNDYYFNLNTGIDQIQTKARKHDQYLLMDLGRRLPGTRIHAIHWIKKGLFFDVVSPHEIKPLQAYAEMIGFELNFKFTKSGTFVRIVNHSEFNQAIRKHFAI